MNEEFYELKNKKPIDKEWISRQLEEFWKQIKNYIDINTLQQSNSENLDINTTKSELIYSTEETATGKIWIDGNPIYRKVFTHSVSNSENSNFTYGTISNFKQLVDARTITNSNNGTNQEASEYCEFRRCRVNISESVATFVNEGNVSYNANEYILIVEYTKI